MLSLAFQTDFRRASTVKHGKARRAWAKWEQRKRAWSGTVVLDLFHLAGNVGMRFTCAPTPSCDGSKWATRYETLSFSLIWTLLCEFENHSSGPDMVAEG